MSHVAGETGKGGLFFIPRASFPSTRPSSFSPPGLFRFAFTMNDATTSLLTEHFSYTPLVRV
jgi:hypothetical protein